MRASVASWQAPVSAGGLTCFLWLAVRAELCFSLLLTLLTSGHGGWPDCRNAVLHLLYRVTLWLGNGVPVRLLRVWRLQTCWQGLSS